MNTALLFSLRSPKRSCATAFALATIFLCCACSTIQSIGSAPLTRGTPKTFNAEFHQLLAAARNALQEEGAIIYYDRAYDAKTHVLIGETPISGFSWGEVIRVVVVDSDNGSFLRVLTERKVASNFLAVGDYSLNIFFRVTQYLEQIKP